MNHTTKTKIKIGIKMHKNKNAEKYNYDYALNLITDAVNYARENDSFFIGQVAQALNVPRKRFSYLVKKYPNLKGGYLFLLTIMEVNVYELVNSNRMPVKLALFLLNYVYGYAKQRKENAKAQEQKTIDLDIRNLIEFSDE